MRATLYVTRFVCVPLVLVAVAGGIAEARYRRVCRSWRNCCPTSECVSQTSASVGASIPLVVANERPVSTEARSAAAASNAFAFDFYRRLSAGEGDRFFSPIGLSMGLALLSRGATGETQRQILDVAHLDADRPEIFRGFAEIRDRLTSGGKGPQVRLAKCGRHKAGIFGCRPFRVLATTSSTAPCLEASVLTDSLQSSLRSDRL